MEAVRSRFSGFPSRFISGCYSRENRAVFLVIWYFIRKRRIITMSDQPAIPLADAVEAFVASLRQRAAPLNTIKSYAHDLRLFIQAMPADLAMVTSEQIQVFLTSDERHSTATRRRR